MLKRKASLSVASTGLALLGAAAWVPELPAQTRFADRRDVVLVEIPVQVEKDGVPVRGLTRDDFEVRDGRKKAEIVTFDVIDLDMLGGADGSGVAPLPLAARRHFLFLFDLSLSDPSKIAEAQRAANELVVAGLHPSDLAAVATYSSRSGIALKLGFTSDRRQLEVAIRTLGLPQLVNRTLDPLSLTLTELAPSVVDPAGGGGREAEAEAEIAALIQEIEGEVTAAARRNQMLAFTSSLAGLAESLGGLDGRKHVVLLSEGFDASSILGTGVGTATEQERIARVSDAAMEGRIWEVGDDERFGATEDQGFLRRMAEEFIRADCTVQSVDVGGLRAGGSATGTSTESGSEATGQDGLFLIADQTGGEFYRNFNRLDEAMNRMLVRTSVTYVLGIQPDKIETDGSFHRLRVKLKNDVKGARLAHRQGYFAPKPSDEIEPFEKKLTVAGQILGGGEGGTIRTAVLAAAHEVAAERAHVPVLIEVDGSSLLDGQKSGVVPTEIYVYGIDREGAIVDYFTRILGLDLKELGPMLRETGLKYWGHLELPPGDYLLRVVVRNDASGRVGIRKLPLKVPDFVGGEGALWPPMIPEPQGKWVFGREKPEEQGDFPYPFVANGQPFIPAVRPTVAGGQDVQLIVAGYHLGPSPRVSGELYASDGSKVESYTVALESAGSATGDGPDHWLARFTTGSLAPGDYRLVITVPGGGGADDRRSEIAIVVGG